ncbi:acetoacetate--CoA ligase [Nocardia sp. 348MFTsu5.1]|uniref:acetoacetate--CoA ligase n=1 Tax=Nocardia sp. 348MFTsu5.1 TaxID=1172185 RepID=UPI00035FE14A|nr:acetoacetate--CoA ligase [Nocardia sp. 348MFTsu5.1]
MTNPNLSEILWSPDSDDTTKANASTFMKWVRQTRGVELSSWDELWEWSVGDLASFWGAVWDFYDVRADRRPDEIISDMSMPGTRWFGGAKLNYAQNILDRMPRNRPAIIEVAEEATPRPWSAEDLEGMVGALSAHLLELGVAPGDRVAAYLPNIPEAVVGLLATTAIGAVWSACGPEFGVTSVVDRFSQIEPKVLLAADGYRFGGRVHDRADTIAELRRRLPSVEATIVVRKLHADAPVPSGAVAFDEIVATARPPVFVSLPADHPLWILFSSGTTGLPKGIVQSHGGIVLEHYKVVGLCLDIGPDDTFFFVSSTSWMAWNLLIGGLLHGATIVVSSASPGQPESDGAFAVAAETGTTVLGLGSAYVTALAKSGSEPQQRFDFSGLKLIMPTGSPLPPIGWHWLDERFDARIDSICGGTDVCTIFFCGNPLTPVRLGEIAGRSLGVKAEAWDEAGRPQVGEVGEMMVTLPMPSMPLQLWGDENGARYRETYFDHHPGVWCQGDWITISADGGVVVTGRSDATLNRGGVRLGSSEIYAVVEQFEEVVDSLVVGTERKDGDYLLALFVVLSDGADLTDTLRGRLAAELKVQLSPRHVPDTIVAAPNIPRTLTGKKLEIPVKRILQGSAPADVASAGAVDDPGALDWFAQWNASQNEVA